MIKKIVTVYLLILYVKKGKKKSIKMYRKSQPIFILYTIKLRKTI